ncbi:hypothetical protein [Acinetobacter baumannii]|uniref:hypothetical protein n=8 Tax=Acinetobacter baumannii TaxID=470 RepID=UPI00286EA72B|nr:hypothetical protein [Acinetobacter baumannii]
MRIYHINFEVLMKVLNSFAIMIACSVSFNICYAKENSEWNDYLQDSTQINSPIEYIDSYNKYTVLNPNLKIKLVDFGNINKIKKDIKYSLKKYGVQILNRKEVYNIFEGKVPLKSNVDFTLLYNDKNIVAFRIRENSNIDYVKEPYKNFTANAYFYNLINNKFIEVPVLNSDSEDKSKSTDILQGDQLTYDSKKGQYIYLANIKSYKTGKTQSIKTIFNSNLKCISSTLGCERLCCTKLFLRASSAI